jgi:hypothetical protein
MPQSLSGVEKLKRLRDVSTITVVAWSQYIGYASINMIAILHQDRKHPFPSFWSRALPTDIETMHQPLWETLPMTSRHIHNHKGKHAWKESLVERKKRHFHF